MRTVTKVFSVMVALAMVLGAFVAIMPQYSASQDVDLPSTDYVPMKIDPAYREKSIDYLGLFKAMQEMPTAQVDYQDYYVVGNTTYYYTDDMATGDYEFLEFVKRGECANCEVWVATDLSFPEGDPRNDDVAKITITDPMVDYIMEEFNNTIYDIETENYRAPDAHYGNESLFEDWGLPFINTDNGTSTMIMIWNIKDDNYYDPDYGSYVVGYYSPTIESYYDRNVIHIDAWNWTERTRMSDPSNPAVYEGTVAHEYQHLLQDDTDPNEATWVNEGLSMYSEFLCGYADDKYFGDMQSFLDCPTNSLTLWGDQGDLNILADYQAVAMFFMYLNDHFQNDTGNGTGAGFIGEIQRDADHSSVDSIEYVLALNNYTETFEELYLNWTLANLYETLYDMDYYYYMFPDAYQYDTFDFWDVAINEKYYGYGAHLNLNISNYYTSSEVVDASDYWGDTWCYYQDASTGTSDVSAWGTEIIRVNMNEYLSEDSVMLFNGDTTIYDMWSMVEDPRGGEGSVWYGGAQNEFESKMWNSVSLPDSESVTLEFDTYYEIEDYWDFGFVQVSTDGETWTSLANEYTTDEYDPSAMSTIIDQLPGITGFADDWTHMSFDLTDLAGEDVLIRFNYATDWGYLEAGWWVDNITVNGEDLTDTMESYSDVGFTVTMVFPDGVYNYGAWPSVMANNCELELNGENIFTMPMAALPGASWYGYMYLLVTPDYGPADYDIGFTQSTFGVPI